VTRLEVRWLNSPVLVGTWLKIPSLITLESTVTAGFDFVIVDMEHSYVPTEWLHTACAVAQAHDVAVLVRLSDSAGRGVSRVLDVGVDGVLFPQVSGPFQAESALRSAVFPPAGTRGVGTTSRAGDWGAVPVHEYIQSGDQDLFRCLQFETRGSFDELDAVLGAPGLSGVFVGPADLAVAYDLPQGDPRVTELGSTLVRAATARNIPCGIAVGAVQDVADAAERGFSFIAVSNDASVYAANITALARNARAAVRG
jgi:2-keto-3-deoxy-L-rhamnonate aldolase RhmA